MQKKIRLIGGIKMEILHFEFSLMPPSSLIGFRWDRFAIPRGYR